MLTIALRFPLGVYHAQAQADFARPEWPPHPVRLIAALVAAAHGGGASSRDVDAVVAVIERLATAGAPLIVAPRSTGTQARPADDEHLVSELRGASRWAPRNHELAELKHGVSPRDVGRGRAEVHKVGTAIGDLPVAFSWPDVTLAPRELVLLRRAAADVTFVGTSRSPVVASVTTELLGDEGDRSTWRAADPAAGTIDVRVPDALTLGQLDRWHERRSAPVAKAGAPSKAPLVVAPRLGGTVAYRHDRDPAPVAALDPEMWGDMLVLEVVGDVVPMAPATFAVARAVRKALLATYAPAGTDVEAPPILRGRGPEPHAAVVPLSFMAERADTGAGAHADGSIKGVAVLLPHPARVSGAAAQRERVVEGLTCLVVSGTEVRVPGVGAVGLAPARGSRTPWTLREGRYRLASERWTTAVPLVHSRYRTAKGSAALLEQVTAECRDVGLPAPAQVDVRRGARLRGAPDRIATKALPAGWAGPLKGPQAHLDLWFDRPVAGPVLLGRARHFGVGLCLPFSEPSA